MNLIQANDYPVYFNESCYKMLNTHLENSKYSKIFIITDNNTNEYCSNRLLSNLETEIPIEIIEFESGEDFKNIETCIQIWEALTELSADRKSVILNLGGGVVTDLGGFVASTFKRGIDFIHIPTTLLAMVDAAIGGKNGVDLGNLKNQIGLIITPKMVLVDSHYLETLPQNQMRSGLAEILKHGLIYDANYWKIFLDLNKVDFTDLDSIIYDSIKIKNDIVFQDPTEKGIRKALNFGHTLGHAIESYFLENTNKNTLLHGEAIAAGMILESFISWELDLLTKEEYYQIKSTIKHIFEDIIFEENDLEPIIELLIHDKKNEYGNIQFALLNGIGKIKIDQAVSNELIYKAFLDYNT
jgi:3-dehydroquinate synthase